MPLFRLPGGSSWASYILPPRGRCGVAPLMRQIRRFFVVRGRIQVYHPLPRTPHQGFLILAVTKTNQPGVENLGSVHCGYHASADCASSDYALGNAKHDKIVDTENVEEDHNPSLGTDGGGT